MADVNSMSVSELVRKSASVVGTPHLTWQVVGLMSAAFDAGVSVVEVAKDPYASLFPIFYNNYSSSDKCVVPVSDIPADVMKFGEVYAKSGECYLKRGTVIHNSNSYTFSGVLEKIPTDSDKYIEDGVQLSRDCRIANPIYALLQVTPAEFRNLFDVIEYMPEKEAIDCFYQDMPIDIEAFDFESRKLPEVEEDMDMTWQQMLAQGISGLLSDTHDTTKSMADDVHRISDSLDSIYKSMCEKKASHPYATRYTLYKESMHREPLAPLDRKFADQMLSDIYAERHILMTGYAGTGKGELAMWLLSELDKQQEVKYCYVSCHGNMSHMDLGYGVNLADTEKFGALLEGMILAKRNPKYRYVLVLDELLTCSIRDVLGACMNLLSARGNMQVYGGTPIENVPNFTIIATGNRGVMYNGGSLIDEAVESRFSVYDVRGILQSQAAVDTYFSDTSRFGGDNASLRDRFASLVGCKDGVGVNLRVLSRLAEQESDDYLVLLQENFKKVLVGGTGVANAHKSVFGKNWGK